jgi:hypothetical protein
MSGHHRGIRGRNGSRSKLPFTCSVALLVHCAPQLSTNVAPPATPTEMEALSLSRESYLLALDSSLAKLRPGRDRVLVHGLDKALPFTAEDLRRRGAEFTPEASVCPGQAALWFKPPRHRDDGRIELEVVEASGRQGFAGSHVYIFRCDDGECQLHQALPGNGDYLAGCRA